MEQRSWRGSAANSFASGIENPQLASGVGDIALGVYVYGPHGQCVAYDDEMLGKVDSDRVAVFVPGRSGAYEFEVRNLSDQTNRRVDADFRPTGGER